MSEPGINSKAVDDAAEWIVNRRELYTRDALSAALLEKGYTQAEVDAAWVKAAEAPATPTQLGSPANDRDLRPKAALIIILGFFGVWAVMSLILMRPAEYDHGFGSLAVMILGACLLVVGVASLVGVSLSDGLTRGREGALVTALVLPFLLLFCIAGLCVASTNGLQV